MSKIINKIRQFIKLSWQKRLLLMEALFWSDLSRLTILLIPFRFISPFLGCQDERINKKNLKNDKNYITDIMWSISTASKHTPWKNTCLVQAITAKMMLKIRKQQSSLFLGIAKDQDKNLKAHAWLSSGDIIVTGSETTEEYTVISSFTERNV